MLLKPSHLLKLACLMALALAAPLRGADRPRKPNILFIFTDDHASHAISAYGSKINKTPNLDRIAQEGMLFRNCFCTNSLCAPSRAVILTGKHSHLNGIVDNRAQTIFDGSQQTFPKLLQKAGYQTAMLGKWHLKSEPTGFDHWAVLYGQGTYYNPAFRTPAGRVAKTGYTTDIITDMALDWLQKGRDKNKPFLLMYQHKAPHRDWQPGPAHLNTYEDVTIPEPPTLFDDYEGRTTWAKKATMRVADHLTSRDLKLTPPRGLTKEQLEKWNAAYEPRNEAFRKANLKGKELVRWKYQRYLKDYLRCIASVDDNVGRVLKYLDESGLGKDTVVVYSSDQGFYLGDHGWFDKRWMYEESLRMPLMVRWPGVVKPGSENSDLVQNLDFAETFLDMAGVKGPDDMQGRSLVPLLKGKTPEDWRKSIYYHYYEWFGPNTVHNVQRHDGVRTDRYKLVHYYLIDEWELFDLKKDPRELKSVYKDPAYAMVVKELKTELERLRKLYKVDQFKEPPVRTGPKRGDPKKVKLSLVLRLVPGEKGVAAEGSLRNLDLGVKNVSLVRSSGGSVMKFDGKGQVSLGRTPPRLDPSWKPLTVGARCNPEGGDGVIIAQGGESLGYSLYLKGGIPHFAIRSGGELYVARGKEKVSAGGWTHVVGVLDADGNARVLVDGQPSGDQVKASFISSKPADGLSVGIDSGSQVGDYNEGLAYLGLLDDVRLYWGVLDEKGLKEWSGSKASSR
jgi:arylsulfatase A-like enzyme